MRLLNGDGPNWSKNGSFNRTSKIEWILKSKPREIVRDLYEVNMFEKDIIHEPHNKDEEVEIAPDLAVRDPHTPHRKKSQRKSRASRSKSIYKQ